MAIAILFAKIINFREISTKVTTDSVWLLQHRLLFQFMKRKSVFKTRNRRHHETAPKKYPRILGNVSKDKRASIQYYFAKYPCFVFSTCLPLGGS